ncbi:peroxiredoxin-like family protein [Micromonospora zhanjiangensis]
MSTTRRHGTRWAVGRTVTGRELDTVGGGRVPVPDPGRLVHLQFRRFAGCPICNLHLRSIVRRHDEIEAAGVREVVVFHSDAAELREHTDDLPFAVVADPARRLYREFGVEAHRRALLDPGSGRPSCARSCSTCRPCCAAANHCRRCGRRTVGSACRPTS